MPRKPYSEDEFDPRPSGDSASAALDVEENGLDPIDAHVLELEPEEESPFLRAQKRVPVRRGPLPKRAVNRLKLVLTVVALSAIVAVCGGALYRYGRTSPRFLLESSDSIQLSGNRNVTRAQVIETFGQDISRNVFLIPLDERKRQLEQFPWVESATVMRLLPNRLRVEIRERTPVAFVQMGSQILLADASGVLMDVPIDGSSKYSFPVITGIEQHEPLSKRAASLQIYMNLIHDLDSGGANYSRDIDEVDLSNPEDVRISVTDQQGQVLIHLGSSHFLERYKVFQAHAQEWRQQFQKLESVDLRYEGQVVVNPDTKPIQPEQGTPESQLAENAVNPPPAPSESLVGAKNAAVKESAAKKAVVAKKPVVKKHAPAKPAAQAKSKRVVNNLSKHVTNGLSKGVTNDLGKGVTNGRHSQSRSGGRL